MSTFKILSLISLIYSTNIFSFDHSHKVFDDIIKKYTIEKDHQTLVNYSNIKNSSSKLIQYLKSLSSVKKSEFKSFNKNEQLAFLINAYNAFTIKIILDNYPLKSIKDIGSFFKSTWKIKFIDLFGDKVHLDHIEHEIIRKEYQEPRIHFAVNCASIGCPSLYREAFIGNSLESQLELATKYFLRNRKKNYYDYKMNIFFISKIFKWYGEDFEKNGKHKLDFVKKYFQIRTTRIDYKYLDYNWNLNEFK